MRNQKGEIQRFRQKAGVTLDVEDLDGDAWI